MSNDSFRRLSEISEYLYDDEVGIIRSIKEIPIEAGAPNFFRFIAIASNTQAFCKQRNFNTGAGTSTVRDTALAKAIGEAIERYCAAIYDPLEFPVYSYNNAPFPCIDPDRFALYDKTQFSQSNFPAVPFTKDTPIRWVAGFDPLTYKTAYIPAAMVYMPYYYYKDSSEAASESQIVQPISTGLACHCSLEEAAINAICEVIERDAFMITWQAMLSTPHVQIESLSRQNIDLVRRFERAGFSVSLFNITTDINVPTILGVLRNDSVETTPIVFAASAALDPDEAVHKSLEELEHTRYYCQNILETMPRLDFDINHQNIVDQKSHLNFWCDKKNVGLSNFIFESDKISTIDEIKNFATGSSKGDLQILMENINTIGHRTILYDLTTKDVLDLGLRVVRAIIPGFHPMFFGYAMRALGGKRLWTVPQKLGYKGIRNGRDNHSPHPYP